MGRMVQTTFVLPVVIAVSASGSAQSDLIRGGLVHRKLVHGAG